MANQYGLTDEQVAHWLKICEAWATWRAVQYKAPLDDSWVNYTIVNHAPSYVSLSDGVEWRIKPEPVAVKAWVLVDSAGKIMDVWFNGEPSESRKKELGCRLIALTGEFTSAD